MPITVLDMQEQAAALLSQLHQQDPSRGTPHLQPHPRGTLHQVDRRPARQPLPVTPGMGSVGSISPERDAGTHRGREGEISCRIIEQQPWWVPSSASITYKPDQAGIMLLYTVRMLTFIALKVFAMQPRYCHGCWWHGERTFADIAQSLANWSYMTSAYRVGVVDTR